MASTPTSDPTSDGGAQPDGGGTTSTDGGVVAPSFAAFDAYLDERLAAGLNGFAIQVFDASDNRGRSEGGRDGRCGGGRGRDERCAGAWRLR